MFSQPRVKNLLDKYVLVQLYTDTVPKKIKQPATSADENRDLLYNRFESAQLPLYVILKPNGKDGQELGRYEEGKINDVEGFARFLEKPLGTTGGLRAQVGRK